MAGLITMRKLAWCLLGLLALPGSAWAAESATARTTVGVLVVGDDPGEVGALQRRLETPLLTQTRVRVISAGELAAELGRKQDEEPQTTLNDSVREQMDKLLDRTADGYANGRYDDASTSVETLIALIQAYPQVGTNRRVNAYLWRTAVFLAAGKKDKAREAAVEALTLAPRLIVDQVTFPPTVVDLVNAVRGTLQEATLRLTGLPPRAVVSIDDRAVTPPVSVPRGEHRLAVSARGFESVQRQIRLEQDTELEVAMPVALEEDASRLVEVIARGGSIAVEDEPRLTELSLRTGVAVWVLAVAESSGTRAVIWWKKGPDPAASPLLSATDEGRKATVDWVASTLAEALETQQREAVRNRYWSLELGWVMSNRVRNLSSVNATDSVGPVGAVDAGVRNSFWGTGPSIAFAVAYKHFFGEIGAATVLYAPTTFTAPDGTEYRRRGNSTTSYGRVYYQHHFRARGKPVVAVRVGVGTWVDNHTIQDIYDETGALGVFPTSFYSGFGAIVGGTVWVPRIEGLELDAQFAATPVGTFTETPAGASGENPRQRFTSVWELKARYRLSDKWSGALELTSQRRELQFTGTALAAYNPPIESATQITSVNSLAVSFRRMF